jgi:hypothetical protein
MNQPKYYITIGFVFISTLLCSRLMGQTNAFELSDPTRPPHYQIPGERETNRENLNLMAIFFSQHRLIAIVNDQVVKEGDRVEGFTVETISENFVKFRGTEGSFTLTLRPDVKD